MASTSDVGLVAEAVSSVTNWFSGMSKNNLAKKQIELQKELSTQAWYQNLAESDKEYIVFAQLKQATAQEKAKTQRNMLWSIVIIVIIVISIIAYKNK
jgi:hypothetical protein